MSIQDEISRLEKDLEAAQVIDLAVLERELFGLNFTCQRCAHCCQKRFGDNMVAMFPGEVRRIMAFTGREWLDVAQPPDSDDFDSEGNRHTFEWVLRRNEDGDCVFLEGNRCTIYVVRPHICRTYPFMLSGDKTEVYECDGKQCPDVSSARPDGRDISAAARGLKDRQVAELREAIELLRRFDPFLSGKCRDDNDIVIVHDSEGTKRVKPGAPFYPGT